MTRDELVEIGFVARAHGLRGEIVVGLHNPDSTALTVGEPLVIGGTSYLLASLRPGPSGLLVTLAGVDDRTAAEALRGKPVEVDRLRVTEPDELLLEDLIGFEVRLIDGSSWGKVVGLELGLQDRLVVHDADVERLVPVVDPLIVEIDSEGSVIVVNPPEGWPATPLTGGTAGAARRSGARRP